MQSFIIPPVTSRVRRLAMAATAALALAVAAPVAFAQPGGGMTLMPRLSEEVKASLNLDTSQQTMWDSAAAQARDAREQGRANRLRVRDAIKTELAKAEPDLATVAAVADAVEQQNRALRQKVRAQWLALYANFTPQQKAVVRDLLQKKLDRAESFREKVLERVRDALRPAG